LFLLIYGFKQELPIKAYSRDTFLDSEYKAFYVTHITISVYSSPIIDTT